MCLRTPSGTPESGRPTSHVRAPCATVGARGEAVRGSLDYSLYSKYSILVCRGRVFLPGTTGLLCVSMNHVCPGVFER